jgi:NADH dehydrogenase/NADH:ubiquinone oxidoreductase subunit G
MTLKKAFELRGWDIEKFESIDPTDGFGSDTRVYISNNQVVQIEPDYNIQTFNTWLTDKGRQFFDGIFETWTSNEGDISTTKNSWLKY